MTTKIFDKFALGPTELKNRIVMAPMTRGRAVDPSLVPVPMMAEYYAQRAGAGLIVTEGTWVSREAIGYINVPGIFDEPQIQGWRMVTDAVHAAGGKIFSQIAHVGAVSHPDLLEGALPLGPSAVNPNEMCFTPDGFKQTLTPREMTLEDIRRTVADFRNAAESAKRAGFDGVELHGAHLFLLPEFLSSATNQRTDEYGGTPEKRARFVLELVDAAIDVWGPKRVGLKVSPALASGLLSPNADTEPTYRYLAQVLNARDLAYFHALGPTSSVKGTAAEAFQDIGAYFRPLYHGTLIVGGGYNAETGEETLRRGNADLIAIGAPFIANPDLVERYRTMTALAVADTELFYTGGAKGYADYPPMQAASVSVGKSGTEAPRLGRAHG